jgi:metal-dependent amidase/aminoacylase/carboxypeptidase family protein
MNSARLKSQICAFLDEMSDLIIGLSQEIHSNPELSFQEYNAVKSICERMKNAGFEIEQNIGGLKTAFRAIHTAQSTGPTIAFLAEYDALPQLGHACGHNIIASIAVGAALGVAKLEGSTPRQVAAHWMPR